ncbi:ABC transporter permease [Acrocarpospora catenulata]|uniref:ABC transporter permease n=1 Tax=Acrocarpospora catenulata TaxID=2836182 RepID=UPI001BDB4A70|nr:ABC transporter permease [Acrocarpospora catenulata]
MTPLGDTLTTDSVFEPRALFRRSVSSSSFWLVLILAALIIGFYAHSSDAFGSTTNITNIALDASGLLVISVAMTFIVITGGIDLSPGAVLVFSQVIGAKVMVAMPQDNTTLAISAGIAAALATGAAWGALNGFLIAYARVPALIATLGTMGMALGGSLIMTNGLNVAGIPSQITSIATADLLGLPLIVVIALLVAILGGGLLKLTRFGKVTFAIGSNIEAVRRAGLSERRHLLTIYLSMGVLAAFAGQLEMARFGTTAVNGHSTDALQAIAAVIIGGTSLFGGVGSLLGTVIGVFIPAVLRNGFLIVGMGAFWQQAVIGAVLIAAVYWDQLKRRVDIR